MSNRSIVKSQQMLAFCFGKGGRIWNLYHR
uniref:Uncharacterized protein n=2 Tax=unclassified Caudoviricetes TaxID=2788787 RepID=A0A8S5MG42_9CAUD|nr:MAG TPA: hypothetical protein [Siphoviridae sp. ctLAG1]DAF13145.1 MAG TPA: hypothetical protein [Caudoviricetes sp.]DAF65323.1 MAG TPA: hypothetical protein [Siphoviridae sp. ct3tr1]DAK30452.1 MAG TPA: hypothetical protein [Bacteriophage sp.]DAF13961.1 MAG TPA: hypothetical protein [Caudoviricetes sp.]